MGITWTSCPTVGTYKRLLFLHKSIWWQVYCTKHCGNLSGSVNSIKNNKPVFSNMSYYGVIEDIWELDYTIFRVPVFWCKWVKKNNGNKVDELEFILVDLNKKGHKEYTFILASQAKLVFYITNTANKKWFIILYEGKNNNWLWW